MQKLNFKEILTPALSLFLICFVIAGALAAVNAVTADPIAANLAGEADDAKQEIFPGATFEDRGDYFEAYAGETLLGYCMDTEAQGYGGILKMAVGLDPEGRVLKVQAVSADGETPGLGQKVKEEGFLSQFTGKADINGIDSIAGATISSKGVEDAVNMALEIYNEQIKGDS